MADAVDQDEIDRAFVRGTEAGLMHTTESRAVYRVGPLGELCDVAAQFRGRVVSGTAVDLSNTGVSVAFMWWNENRRELPHVGNVVELTLTSHMWAKPITINAQARHRTDSGGSDLCVFGFEFLESPDIAEPGLHGLFNRRQAVRVQPRRDQTVHVLIETPASSMTGEIRDISMTGIGMFLDPSAEVDLADHAVVRLRFALDPNDELCVPAAIRNRRYVDQSSLIYGFTFQDTAGAPTTPAQVQAYVMQRQREDRRSRMELADRDQ